MTDRETRIQALTEAASERILVFGGPYGTYLQGAISRSRITAAGNTRAVRSSSTSRAPTSSGRRSRAISRPAQTSSTTNTFGGRVHRPRRVRPRRTRARDQQPPASLSPGRSPTRTAPRRGRASSPATWARRRSRYPSPAASRSTRLIDDLRRAGAASSPVGVDLLCCSRRRTTRARSRPALIGIWRAVR